MKRRLKTDVERQKNYKEIMRRNIGQEGKKVTEEKVTELPPELQVRLWPSHSVSVHLP